MSDTARDLLRETYNVLAAAHELVPEGARRIISPLCVRIDTFLRTPAQQDDALALRKAALMLALHVRKYQTTHGVGTGSYHLPKWETQMLLADVDAALEAHPPAESPSQILKDFQSGHVTTKRGDGHGGRRIP